MKAKGRHPEKALTAVQVKQTKAPGRYADGNGLYLEVETSGAKRWLLRVMVQGRRRDIGLGGVSLVSLAEAREKAVEYRRVAREGGDPIAHRKVASVIAVPTFLDAAERVHAEHEAAWKNKKHTAQWISSLKQYAVPVIGSASVDKIDTPAVLRVLLPMWLTKPETARRVRQRFGTVLDWAKASGFRTGDNPINGTAGGLPRQNKGERHHAALPFADVAGFVKKLHATNSSESAKLAFEFLIQTASRTSEVLLARWDEVDGACALWTVPAVRMKANRIHRVPLSPRCSEILAQARLLAGGSALMFPGQSVAKPLSNMVFLTMLKRMKLDITAHGFRSAFRDWAAETTNFPREVVEMALSHTIENKVEAAYRRGDLLDKRRELMEAWSQFIATASSQ